MAGISKWLSTRPHCNAGEVRRPLGRLGQGGGPERARGLQLFGHVQQATRVIVMTRLETHATHKMSESEGEF